MRVYRASRKPQHLFAALDSTQCIARDGWRFNDSRTEILYAAEVEALAILEVVARPGWESVEELTVAIIEVPDNAIVGLADLGLVLPADWDQRPVARNAQRIGREFLAKADEELASGRTVCGVRVPSVISSTDHSVLLDPRKKPQYEIAGWSRIPVQDAARIQGGNWSMQGLRRSSHVHDEDECQMSIAEFMGEQERFENVE